MISATSPYPNPDDDLARLWDATRPAEPADASWDAVWARVSAGLDARAGATAASDSDLIPFAPRRALTARQWAATAVVGLAQAAAVLAAMFAGLGSPARPPAAPAVVATAAVAAVEIDPTPNEAVLIREDGAGKATIVAIEFDERPNTLDGNFAMLNTFESMAE